MKGTPTYATWQAMRTRCLNSDASNYERYGGRGITICERWNSFESFLADMGERPSLDHSIDRYPNTDGNYEPKNCRWATWDQQATNQRDSLTEGEVLEVLGRREHGESARSIAERMGVSAATVRRICNGETYRVYIPDGAG